MKSAIIWITWAFGIGVAGGFIICRSCTPEPTPADPIIKRDTVVIRDTVRPPVPKPQIVTVVRRDTVRITVVQDVEDKPLTDTVRVEIPISRSIYKTDDYKATIEGYNARLVDMELYRRTTVITNTVPKLKSPRWALTVGPGIGYGPNGWRPYIGASVGFVILSR